MESTSSLRGPKVQPSTPRYPRRAPARGLEIELAAEVQAVDTQVAARVAAGADVPPVFKLVAEGEPRPALVARRRVGQADVEREGGHRLRAVEPADRTQDLAASQVHCAGEALSHLADQH